MIAKKGISKKRKMMLGAVSGLALLCTLVLVYFGFIRQPDLGTGSAGAGGLLTAPSAQIDTSFKTEIFDDPRIQNLKQFGPASVEVQGRGRTIDPFQPF